MSVKFNIDQGRDEFEAIVYSKSVVFEIWADEHAVISLSFDEAQKLINFLQENISKNK